MAGSRFSGLAGAENAPQRPSARHSLMEAVASLVSCLAHGLLRLDSNPTPPLNPSRHMAGTCINASQRSSCWSAAARGLLRAPLGLLAATRPRIWGLRAARVEPGGDFGHHRCERAGLRAVVCAAWLRAACARSEGVEMDAVFA